VGRKDGYADKSGRGLVMADVLYAWIEQLIIEPSYVSEKVIKEWRIPGGIRFISCQKEACVIGKCDGKAGTGCS